MNKKHAVLAVLAAITVALTGAGILLYRWAHNKPVSQQVTPATASDPVAKAKVSVDGGSSITFNFTRVS
jgi:Flp pilus assembly protein CpaB